MALAGLVQNWNAGEVERDQRPLLGDTEGALVLVRRAGMLPAGGIRCWVPQVAGLRVAAHPAPHRTPPSSAGGEEQTLIHVRGIDILCKCHPVQKRGKHLGKENRNGRGSKVLRQAGPGCAFAQVTGEPGQPGASRWPKLRPHGQAAGTQSHSCFVFLS